MVERGMSPREGKGRDIRGVRGRNETGSETQGIDHTNK